jgi:hypothetical protein
VFFGFKIWCGDCQNPYIKKIKNIFTAFFETPKKSPKFKRSFHQILKGKSPDFNNISPDFNNPSPKLYLYYI